jgi:integrase
MVMTIAKKDDFDFSAIDRANLQPTTKWKYRREIQAMIDAKVNPLDYKQLGDYAAELKSSRKAFLKYGLKVVLNDVMLKMKSSATPQNVAAIQAAIMRIEAMDEAIVVPVHKGVKAHIWLTNKQVKEMTSFCGNDQKGRADWIILSILVGAGLRREEMSGLKFDAIKTQPSGESIRYVLAVKGKGAKDRIVPISNTLAKKMLAWKDEVGGGNVGRALGRNKKLRNSISAKGIFNIVRHYGALIGLPELASHDLRRTFAQIAIDNNVPLAQVSLLLGHKDIKTTMRYLNLELDLKNSASEHVDLYDDDI